MTRPAGVTASAIVATLGSALALLMASAAVASLFMPRPQPQPPNSTQAVIMGATLFAVLAGVGIWTSVGLFRMRSWARTSILIIACFIAGTCLVALVATTAVPLPATISSDTRQFFRWTMAFTFGVPIVVSAWWLVQFNTAFTRAAFAARADNAPSPRPVAITVIAVSMFVSSATCVVPLLMRAPGFVLGAVINGWLASIFYAALAALAFYIGKGLLELRERARLLAMGWFIVWFLHSWLISAVPFLRRRLELQTPLPRNPETVMPFDPSLILNASLVAIALTTAAAIWFLSRDRDAFVRAENARDWPGLHA